MTRDFDVVAPGVDDPARLLGDDAAVGGTYTLVLTLPSSHAIDVGALGTHEFPAGAYAYTGSALGAGGFSRVDRHRRVAAGDHDVRHWHVDYLTGHSATTLVAVCLSPDVDRECAVAAALPDGPVSGFGASDCDCESHLASRPSVDSLLSLVETAHTIQK